MAEILITSALAEVVNYAGEYKRFGLMGGPEDCPPFQCPDSY